REVGVGEDPVLQLADLGDPELGQDRVNAPAHGRPPVRPKVVAMSGEDDLQEVSDRRAIVRFPIARHVDLAAKYVARSANRRPPSTGFGRYSVAPASRHFSRSPFIALAVRATISRPVK